MNTAKSIARLLLFTTTFILGILIVNTIQLPALFLYHVLRSRRLYRSYARMTEQLFGSILVLTTWLVCPLELVISGDAADALDSSSRAVVIANHQIYTDWWYFWLFA